MLSDLSIAETKDSLRSFFKQCGVKINLASKPFQNNTIIDVSKINKLLEESDRESFFSGILQFDKIILLCNNMDKLPEWVKDLKNINGFILLGILSHEFINEITCFKQIKELLLLNTEISMLPASIGDNTELCDLYIFDSQITSCKFPNTIGQLKKLQSLVVSGTTIDKLPITIGNLESLEVLDISGTAIDMLPESIGRLKNLKTLDISDTMIKKIPDSISNLNRLDHFYLYGLTIDKMPWFENCTKGTDVFCDKFDNYVPFSLRHQPSSLFNQSPEIIQQYYDEDKEEINDFKVIFLGYGAAGKTHTVKRMKNHGKLQDYDTRQTEGIDISEETFTYETEEIKLSLWDFGGQDKVYSMHRCFLTERACYVVVVSNRLHESLQDQAQYWLRNINIFAKRSSVIIAVNNSEQTYSEGVNTELLRKQFPEILIGDSISYSAKCSLENEFNLLTNAILKQIHNLDNYKMEFPKNWIGIINEIKNNENDYISKKQYRKICEDNNVNSPAIRKWLLSWFHDLGYCFCNHIDHETGYELEDYQIISPNWITTAMYRINHAHDALNGNKKYIRGINFEKGTIGQNTLYLLINDVSLGGHPQQRYEIEETDYILDVMRKFKLSYRISSDLEFIPILCDYEKTVDLLENEFDKSMVYYIKYNYLPDSIIHRLMIALYQNEHILTKVWRYGFSLAIKNYFHPEDTLKVVVEMGRENEMLELRIFGKTVKARWECLWYMIELITQINSSTNCQAIEEYIEKRKKNQIAYLPLSSILKAKEKGYSEIWSTDGGEYESYSLNEIIDETFGEKSFNNAIEMVEDNSLQPYRALIEARTHHNEIASSINHNYNFFGEVYVVNGNNTTINNNLDAEQMLSLMERFLNIPALTENALDELQEALGNENNELKEEMQQAKDNDEERKSILSRAVEQTKKVIGTANDVNDTMESGISTAKKLAETGEKIIHFAAPIIAVLHKYLGG